MTTLGDLKATIADDLARDDLTAQIAGAISGAIKLHQSKPFWFARTRSAVFDTQTGRRLYDEAYAPAIGLIASVDRVFLSTATAGDFDAVDFDAVDFDVGSLGSTRMLYPASQETVELSQADSGGEPAWYSFYRGRFHLMPTPDEAGSVVVLGDVLVAEPVDDAETANPWMNEGYGLIRAEAMRFLAVYNMRNPALAADMAGEVARELKELRETSARKDATMRLEPAEGVYGTETRGYGTYTTYGPGSYGRRW